MVTYKKLGLLGNILTLITDQSYYEYRINTAMTVSRASLDENSLKIVLSPTPAIIIGKKSVKKVLIVIGVVFLVSLAGLTIVFPPAILIFILAAILAVLLMPFVIIESVRKKQIIKKGRGKLIDAIQEVIRLDYQTDM